MATSPRLPGHIGDPSSSAFHKITDAPSLLAVSSQKLRESVAMLPDDSFAVDFDSAEGQEDAPFLPPALYSDEETKAERPLRSKPEQANKPKKKGKKPKASKNAGSVHDDCASGDLAEGASSKKKSSLSSGDSGNVAGSMKRLLREAKTQWVRMAVGSICLFGAAVCNLLSPALFGNILDALTRVIVYDRTEALAIAQRNCGWLIFVTIFGAFLSFGRSYMFAYAGEQMVANIRRRLFRSMLVQEVQFFDTCRTGELISRLSSDTVVLKDAVTSDIAMAFRWTATALGSLIYLFVLSWKLALLVVVLIPVSSFSTKLYGKYVKKLSKEARKALANATCVAEEAVSNIKTVKSFVQEPQQFAKFSAEIAGTLHLGMHAAVATGVFNGALAGFSTLVFTAIIYFGVHQVADGGMSVGVLTSFLLYAMSVNDALSSLAGLYSHLMKAIGATERVFELLDREPAMKPSGGQRLPDLQGRIEFRNVEFAYQSRPDTKVLNGASFVIEPGQVVALVGLSGAGKSTCVSLMERFYDPQQGDVYVDGVDAKDLDLSWLRANIGLVNQDPVLFCTSIAENIAFGVRNGAEADIVAAAKLANAHTFISKFPDGYGTVVGERGTRLSGGQQQRVAIARAIMKDPKILILDEATSSLDAHSEHLVQEALERLMAGRTTLVIAHRLSTVQNADIVMVMENGRIVSAAPHHILMQTNALYASLVNRQLRAFDSTRAHGDVVIPMQ